MRTSTDDPADTHVSAGSRAVRPGSGTWRWSVGVPLALVLAVLVRTLVLESWFVPDAGMAPTLRGGDRVLVLKVAGSVERGDVVVVDVSDTFAGPSRATHEASGLIGSVLGSVARALGVRNGARSVVARVVAVGGDDVTCAPSGQVLVGGAPVSGPVGCSGLQVHVPPGSLWVLGDDPAHAFDSLSQTGADVTRRAAASGARGDGLVGEEDVVGRVLLRWWPLDGAGLLPSAAQRPAGGQP